MGITEPPPTVGAWRTLFINLSDSGLDNYEVIYISFQKKPCDVEFGVCHVSDSNQARHESNLVQLRQPNL